MPIRLQLDTAAPASPLRTEWEAPTNHVDGSDISRRVWHHGSNHLALIASPSHPACDPDILELLLFRRLLCHMTSAMGLVRTLPAATWTLTRRELHSFFRCPGLPLQQAYFSMVGTHDVSRTPSIEGLQILRPARSSSYRQTCAVAKHLQREMFGGHHLLPGHPSGVKRGEGLPHSITSADIPQLSVAPSSLVECDARDFLL